jgi:L-fucose mutarotase
LNLTPGIVTVAQVLYAILSAIPIERINTMGIPPDDPYALKGDPPVWKEYRQILKSARLKPELHPIEKWKFYDAVASPDHVLTVQTADQALWANVLLTIGVRQS